MRGPDLRLLREPSAAEAVSQQISSENPSDTNLPFMSQKRNARALTMMIDQTFPIT